jgi:hypothetical protein
MLLTIDVSGSLIQCKRLSITSKNKHKDLNVDIYNTKSVVEKLVDDQQSIQVSVIKNATHIMLDAKYFNEQAPGLTFLFKLIWKGDKAVVPEFHDVLDECLSRQN